jgi:hypothetical protein
VVSAIKYVVKLSGLSLSATKITDQRVNQCVSQGINNIPIEVTEGKYYYKGLNPNEMYMSTTKKISFNAKSPNLH